MENPSSKGIKINSFQQSECSSNAFSVHFWHICNVITKFHAISQWQIWKWHRYPIFILKWMQMGEMKIEKKKYEQKKKKKPEISWFWWEGERNLNMFIPDFCKRRHESIILHFLSFSSSRWKKNSITVTDRILTLLLLLLL